MFWWSVGFFVLSILCVWIRLSTKKSADGEAVFAGKVARTVGIVLAFAGLGLLGGSMLVTVSAGTVGVQNLWGDVSGDELEPGFYFRNPFLKVVEMSTQTIEFKEEMSTPTSEGLSVSLEVSVMYHIDRAAASDIYKEIGENYFSVLVQPQIRSIVRGVTASNDAKSLYTSTRESLASQVCESLRAVVSPRGIIVESTPIRKVDLPQKINEAIQAKMQAEQETQRMQFVLEKEKLEAERKVIEATGIADFQKIVSQGIDANLLKWKGIEATLELAKSANAKTVIMSGDDLPVILGGEGGK